jgi:hypothetical protein
MPEPRPNFAEQVYFFELMAGEDGLARVLLRNAEATRGASVSFAVAQLPYFTLWKNTAPSHDGYVCGLEPAINFPNPRSFEERQGRVRKLLPGETLRFDLQIDFHDSAAEVERTEKGIRQMQRAVTSTIYREPRPQWSA